MQPDHGTRWGVVGHAGAHGVEVDVAHAAQQVVRVVDQARLVAAFPQRAGAPVARVELRGVLAAKPLHHAAGRAGCGRRHQQVDVVVHQHIGVEPAIVGEQRLAQQMAVAGAVGIVQETGQAVVAALHDVSRDTGKIESPLACHATSIAPARRDRQRRCAWQAVGFRRPRT